jgi:hypothetical protein
MARHEATVVDQSSTASTLKQQKDMTEASLTVVVSSQTSLMARHEATVTDLRTMASTLKQQKYMGEASLTAVRMQHGDEAQVGGASVMSSSTISIESAEY